jgi:hypothetical protein
MSRRSSENGDSLEPEHIELNDDDDAARLAAAAAAAAEEADSDLVIDADDFSFVSINTPRMWILSMLFSIFGSSINLFFSLRYPSISISPIIALLLAHPLGLLWDGIFPSPDFEATFPRESTANGRRSSVDESSPLLSPELTTSSSHGNFPKPKSWSRLQYAKAWLGQGRWNAKEHCCVYIASNVSFGFAFATDVCTHPFLYHMFQV